MTTVSIIIPVYNGAADLPACLAALGEQRPRPDEIIAVDNASSDGSADLIAAQFPHVRLLRQTINLGFGGACNAGMAAATGDLLILLNQDTEVQPGWLSALVAVMAERPDVGIAGSKALYPNGHLQHAGGTIDAQGGGHHRGHGDADIGQFDRVAEVAYVTGASMALRSAVFDQIGGFDPAFNPAYSEDVDLCLTVRNAGLRVVYVPDSVLIHHERSTAAGASPNAGAMFLQHRNRLRVVAKHWPAARLRDEFLPAERAWLEGLQPGGERLVAAVHRAYLTHLLGLGELATWRSRLLDEDPAQIDTLAEVLLTLRTAYPTHLVDAPSPAGPDALPSLGELTPLAAIREHPFHSDVPLVGGLIARFRQAWNRVSTEWYVKPMMRQQSQFNETLIKALRQTQEARAHDQHYQARVAAILNEYIAGQTAEISALGREVAALQRDVAALRDATAGAPSNARSPGDQPEATN